MKKAIFLVIISLALQGFSQIRSGVYFTNDVLDFKFVDGEQDGKAMVCSKDTYIHITETGFRLYGQKGDTGESFSLVYMGLDSDGYEVYAVPDGARLEYKDGFLVLFYNFDNDTGWYKNSTEFHDIVYLNNSPNLNYED